MTMFSAKDYENKVLCGEFLVMTEAIPPGFFDFVFTDPPYNFGVSYECWDDSFPMSHYQELVRSWSERMMRLSLFGCLFLPEERVEYFRAVMGEHSLLIPVINPMLNRHRKYYILFWGAQAPQDDYVQPIKLSRLGEDHDEDHPTPTPFSLVRRILMQWTKPDDLVLDPFAGIGTTGLVAIDLGRRFCLIEVDCSYCRIARKRVKERMLYAQKID